jgi:predicted metal-dependent hydrolase
MSKLRTLETPAGPALLKRTSRTTLAISVLPDGTLELTAPLDSEESSIQAKVGKRTRWIERQRRAFADMNATRMPRRYVTGATHRYLGKQYRLKILAGERGSVLLKGAYFHVVSTSGSQDEIRGLLDAWFRDKARQQFTRRIGQWRPWCQRNQLPEPTLVLRRMPKRWGSAGRNGRIALNPELIHAPSACIDYVIAHEICHLKHPDHSPSFFRLLSSKLPDWKGLKARLERMDID